MTTVPDQVAWATSKLLDVQRNTVAGNIVALDTESTSQSKHGVGKVENRLSLIGICDGLGRPMYRIRVAPDPGYIIVDYLTSYSGLDENSFWHGSDPMMSRTDATALARKVLLDARLGFLCNMDADLPLLGVGPQDYAQYSHIKDIQQDSDIIRLLQQDTQSKVSLSAAFTYFFGLLHQEPTLDRYQTALTSYGTYRLKDGRTFEEEISLEGHGVIDDCRATVAIGMLVVDKYLPNVYPPMPLPDPVAAGWAPMIRYPKAHPSSIVDPAGINITVIGLPRTSVLALAAHIHTESPIRRIILNRGMAKLYPEDEAMANAIKLVGRLRSILQPVTTPFPPIKGCSAPAVLIAHGTSIQASVGKDSLEYTRVCDTVDKLLLPLPRTSSKATSLLANTPLPKLPCPVPITDDAMWSTLFPAHATPTFPQTVKSYSKFHIAFQHTLQNLIRSHKSENSASGRWGRVYVYEPGKSGWAVASGIRVENEPGKAACKPHQLVVTGPPPVKPVNHTTASATPNTAPTTRHKIPAHLGPLPEYMRHLPPGRSPISKEGTYITEAVVLALAKRHQEQTTRVAPPGTYVDGIHLKDIATGQIVRDPDSKASKNTPAWKRLKITNFIPPPTFFPNGWADREQRENKNKNSGPVGKNYIIQEVAMHCAKYPHEYTRIMSWLNTELAKPDLPLDNRDLYQHVKTRIEAGA